MARQRRGEVDRLSARTTRVVRTLLGREEEAQRHSITNESIFTHHAPTTTTTTAAMATLRIFHPTRCRLSLPPTISLNATHPRALKTASPSLHPPELQPTDPPTHSQDDFLNILATAPLGRDRKNPQAAPPSRPFGLGGDARDSGDALGTSALDELLTSFHGHRPVVGHDSAFLNRAIGGMGSLAPAPLEPAEPPPPPFALDRGTGRTLRVDAARGMDVGRAFRMMEIRCSTNAVRRMAMDQRFHERPGLRRKRLRMARWRKNFNNGFSETINEVYAMRRQGW